jgi:hypothetical protein
MTDSSFVPMDEVLIGGGPGSTPSSAPGDPAVEAERVQRLATGVRTLRTRSGFAEHALMIIGGILAPVGLITVFLGWWGASHTPYLFEQVPYVISGGLLGIGLVFLGGFLYFTHWLTELVREHRIQSAAVVEAVGRLELLLSQGGVAAAGPATSNGHAVAAVAAPAPADDVVLVATGKGTMAHRPDCVVVANKPRSALRRVGVADGLEPCKLCGPYGN